MRRLPSKVRRDGQWQEISARDLVPGDIVLLEAGRLVPADGRLLETYNLRIQESTLTGESQPVEKDSNPLAATAQIELADRSNMGYMGTMATYGRGIATVTETGNGTQLGDDQDCGNRNDSTSTPDGSDGTRPRRSSPCAGGKHLCGGLASW